MSEYTLSVTVDLDENLDEGPLNTLSSIILAALADCDVPVKRVEAVEGSGAREMALGKQMWEMIQGAEERRQHPGEPDDIDALVRLRLKAASEIDQQRHEPVASFRPETCPAELNHIGAPCSLCGAEDTQ